MTTRIEDENRERERETRLCFCTEQTTHAFFLQATADFLRAHAILTLNIATPLESAIASFAYGDDLRLIPTIATEQIASINGARTPIAHTSDRSQRAEREIHLAIVRTGVVEDEIVAVGHRDGLLVQVKGKIAWHEAKFLINETSLQANFDRVVVVFFQLFSNLSERVK